MSKGQESLLGNVKNYIQKGIIKAPMKLRNLMTRSKDLRTEDLGRAKVLKFRIMAPKYDSYKLLRY